MAEDGAAGTDGSYGCDAEGMKHGRLQSVWMVKTNTKLLINLSSMSRL